MSNLSPADFDFLRKLVMDRSSIVLEASKEYLVESRLIPVLRHENIGDIAELVTMLRRGGLDAKRIEEAVIDAMTTNETSFFRDTHPWETLKTDLIPELIEARKATRSLTFYCAACSSGQEPYSLAMTLNDHFPDIVRSWKVRIIGTDLSPTMVRKASEGRFSQLEVNRGLPARSLMTHFTRAGAEWQISEANRKLVTIQQGNLTDALAWNKIPPLDGLFIRNVLIYFDDATRTQILGSGRKAMRDDGFLMIGSSENSIGTEGRFNRDQIGRTYFFRPLTNAMSRV